LLTRRQPLAVSADGRKLEQLAGRGGDDALGVGSDRAGIVPVTRSNGFAARTSSPSDPLVKLASGGPFIAARGTGRPDSG